MLESEREARRSMSDTGSWSQRAIARRVYRSMVLTPDEEVPKHQSSRRKRKKHVHKWGEWIREGEEVRPSWGKPRHRVTIVKWVRQCKKCGYRDKGESLPFGEIKKSRYIYFW